MKPRPCPMCGSKAITFRRYDRSDYPDEKNWDIKCSDADCYLYDGADYWFESEEAAISKWNSSIEKRYRIDPSQAM